ncbi:MAG: carboxypeptidase M32 [Lachnospiraceae bacterium]|nr:carboxypeptidase M32 [Lachnospiraceae bacterium]
MSYQTHLEYIRSINDQFRYYKTMESMFELDQWSALPLEGGAYRQEVVAHIAELKASLFDSDEAKSAANYFKGANLNDIEDDIERGLVRSFLFRYRNQTRTPKHLMHQYSMMKAETMNKWKEAREKQDFNIFVPWLTKVFDLKKQIAYAINPDVPAFDTLVNVNDEGTSCEEISREFDVLKVGLTKLRSEIEKSTVKPDSDIFNTVVDPVRVEAFSQRLARESGYQESRGGFNNKVVHAFTSFMGPRDARVSTYQSGSLNMIFTCLHEAGHAMYASGGSDAVNAANMWGGIEGSFQESMARFNENIIGRSRAYWEYYYPQLQAEFSQFVDVSLDDFYLSMNVVKPSLRRITADEVTYSLHVILRYELERDCFGEKIAACDLRDAWNDLSEKYLGIRPSNDTEGVLQDMHWAGDYIGYFQSYALGNIYCGQLRESIFKEIPDFEEQLRQGSFVELNKWLDKNVRQYGCCFTAGEMAKRITGKSLDARPFLQYLEEKYKDLYRLTSERM